MDRKSLIKKINRGASLLKNDALFNMGFRGKSNNICSGIRIIVYHGIDNGKYKRYNSRFLSQKKLTSHIKLFLNHGKIISFSDLISGRFDRNAFNFILTFDDGYQNNIHYALPVLESFKIPATFCITGIANTDLPILWPDYLDIAAEVSQKRIYIEGRRYDSKKMYPWHFRNYYDVNNIPLKQIAKSKNFSFISKLLEELQSNISIDGMNNYSLFWHQLNRKEIRQIADSPYAEIASHGYYHTSLGEIPFVEACSELRKSKSILEDIIQQPISTIAYPDGSYNSDLVDYGLEIGYNNHLVVDYNNENDIENPAIWERITINPYISSYNQLLAILKGSYL